MRARLLFPIFFLIAVLSGSASASAQSLMDGYAAFGRQDYATALSIFQTLAASGDAEAQLMLGYCHGKGIGLTQDYGAALRWYRLAAEQGRGRALYALAFAYEKGEGVAIDRIEAYKWRWLSLRYMDPRNPEYKKEMIAMEHEHALRAAQLTEAEKAEAMRRAEAWIQSHPNLPAQSR